MNKFFFYLYQLFIVNSIQGIKDIGKEFTKPSNLVNFMFYFNILFIIAGLITSRMGKPIPLIFYATYLLVMILVMVWKHMLGGDIEHKWKKYLEKKMEEHNGKQ